MIHIIVSRATPEQIHDMSSFYGTVIKVAVDIEKRVLAGGGEMHADCEAALLQIGSRNDDIWGANWTPSEQKIEYEALLNIRARQNNRTMFLQDPARRERVRQIVTELLGGIEP
ncbi:MAG: hypothetical protein EYC68_10235 [Chloroflexota bacterium]|nr:MAG: hypothetical protein EYC68_10235 [Chloroflexota bacterium]